MTFRSKTVALIALSALAFNGSIAAYAAGAATTIKAVDTDSDGTISLDEAKKAAMANFDSMDADHEGILDPKEAKGMNLKMIDTDKDGTVDKAEFAAAVEMAFKKANPDGDDSVDAKELGSAAGKDLSKMIKPS